MFTPKKSSRHSTVREDPLFEEFVLYLRLLRPLIRRALSQDRAWRDDRGSRFGSSRSVPFSTLVFNVDMIAERGVHSDAVLEQFDHLDDEFGLAVLPTGSAVFVPGHGPEEVAGRKRRRGLVP